MKKHTKHRLSTIDLLPQEAEPAIARACTALDEESTPKTVILKNLNLELKELGLEPISEGAFSRFSMKQQTLRLRRQRVREAAKVFGADTNALEEANISATVAAYLRDIIFEAVSELDPKTVDYDALGKLCKSLYDVNRSEGVARDQSRKADQAASKKAAQTAVKAAKTAGLPDEAINRLKDALGFGA